jgi:hypothetical protein
MSGLSMEEVEYLESEGIDYEVTGESTDMGPDGQEIPVYSCDIRYDENRGGRIRIEAVPPEEVVFTPEARTFKSAPLVAHRRELPYYEVLAMGVDEEFLDEHKGEMQSTSTESLEWARQFYGSSANYNQTRSAHSGPTHDPMAEPVTVTEAWSVIEGELRRFLCIGPAYEIWNGEGEGELADDIPIAVFTPDPEPHTVLGLCNWDYLKEIQKVKSQIQRGQLNSLAQSIENQLVVSQAQVNMRDLVSPEISGLIRVRSDVGAVREIKHQFVGADTLPVLEYYDQIRRDRTGREGPNEGMDPNIMQSTTAEAVSATLSKAQKRVKMLARVYAETGFKHLFLGVYRLLTRHQKREEMIKLRGHYVPVNPATWDADMDVRVAVALGTGSKTARIQELQFMSSKQEEHLSMGSPLVNFAHLRQTYGRMTDLMGYKNTDEFWAPWGEEQQQQFEQQQAEAAENAEKEPEQRIVDIEEMKVSAQVAQKQEEMRLKELEIRLKDERERVKMQLDAELRRQEIEAKMLQHKVDIHDGE